MTLETLAIDIETSGVDPWNGELLCLGVASSSVSQVFDAKALPRWVLRALSSPHVALVAHTTFDFRFLKLAGYEVNGPYYDTKLMAHLLDENTPGDLEWLVNHYLGYEMDKRLTRRDKTVYFRTDAGESLLLSDAYDKHSYQVQQYCKEDVECTHQLFCELYTYLDRRSWTSYWLEEEAPFTEVLVNMECAGLPIRLDLVEEAKPKLQEQIATARTELRNLVGYEINWDSGDQLESVLFDKVWCQESKHPITKAQRDALKDEESGLIVDDGFEVIKVGREYAHGYYTRKGFGLRPKTPLTEKKKRHSTSTPDLLALHAEKPIVQALVKYRKNVKVMGTYLETYPEHTHNGRLYGRYNQSGTVTGRLSSSSPNMQNQPSRGPLGELVRGLFQGDFVIGDHSQLEPRLMAHFSQDPELLQVYTDDDDIYSHTAGALFGRSSKDDRQMCKRLILALGYGAEADTIARGLSLDGFPTKPETAEAYLRELRSLYKVFFAWREHISTEAKDKGYVKTIGGRYRRVKSAFKSTASWKQRARGERQAVNAVIQGSAADILRRNMLRMAVLEQYWPIRLLAQVHDELIFERYDPEEYKPEWWHQVLLSLKAIAEAPEYDLSVPLKFEPQFCKTWAEKGRTWDELWGEAVEDQLRLEEETCTEI